MDIHGRPHFTGRTTPADKPVKTGLWKLVAAALLLLAAMFASLEIFGGRGDALGPDLAEETAAE